jgi:hypothetical protein
MNKNEILSRVAAIITTLDETNGSPESMLYIFFDMNMDLWTKVRCILVETDLVQIKGNFVTLTANGRATAQRLNKVISN